MNNRRNISFTTTNSNNTVGRTFPKRGRGRGRGRGSGRARGRSRGRGRIAKRNFSSAFNSSNVTQPNKRQRLNNFGGIQQINNHLSSGNLVEGNRTIIKKKKIISKPSQGTISAKSASNLKFTINNEPKLAFAKRNVQKKSIKLQSTIPNSSFKKNIIINKNKNEVLVENNNNDNKEISESPTNSEKQNEEQLKLLRARLMKSFKVPNLSSLDNKEISKEKGQTKNQLNIPSKNSQPNNKSIQPQKIKKTNIQNKVKTKMVPISLKKSKQISVISEKKKSKAITSDNNNIIQVQKPVVKNQLSLFKDDIIDRLNKELKQDGLDFTYNKEDEKFIEEEILKYESNKEYHLSQENWHFWTKLLGKEQKEDIFQKSKILQNLWKNYIIETETMVKNCEEEIGMNFREFEIDFGLLEDSTII